MVIQKVSYGIIVLLCALVININAQTKGQLSIRKQPSQASEQKTKIIDQGSTKSTQDTAKSNKEQKTEIPATMEEKQEKEEKKQIEPKNITNDIVPYIAFGVFFLWIAFLLAYYWWAIRYHVINYGYSKKMWKILYPEALGRSWGKDQKNLKKIREQMIQRRIDEQAAQGSLINEDYALVTTPFKPAEENQYKQESFGLPPGTIRGTLALTALVMFILIEGVNLFSVNNLEEHFEGLITALQMVLAFYFGSKAVDVLKAKTDTKVKEKKETEEKLVPPELAVDESEVEEEPDLPSERPVLVPGLSEARFVNVREEKKPPSPNNVKAWHAKADLSERILALTASFETGQPFPDCFTVLAGNFDGQGLSFGTLQWNIGQGTLQPLLRSMLQNYEQVVKDTLGDKFNEFKDMLYQTKPEQLQWAKSIQHMTNTKDRIWRIDADWNTRLQELGKTPAMIDMQVHSAQTRYNIAKSNCHYFKLTTERGLALMFDINVQNGRVDRKGAGDRIFKDYLKIPAHLSEEDKQVEMMKIIAIRRSEVSYPRWRKDVENRKMTIAKGDGTVHGRHYKLKEDYSITLKKIV